MFAVVVSSFWTPFNGPAASVRDSSWQFLADELIMRGEPIVPLIGLVRTDLIT